MSLRSARHDVASDDADEMISSARAKNYLIDKFGFEWATVIWGQRQRQPITRAALDTLLADDRPHNQLGLGPEWFTTFPTPPDLRRRHSDGRR